MRSAVGAPFRVAIAVIGVVKKDRIATAHFAALFFNQISRVASHSLASFAITMIFASSGDFFAHGYMYGSATPS